MKDLGKAFSFPFKDPSWVTKFIVAAIFILLAFALVGLFIVAGYLVQVTQRVMRRDPQPLPEWTDIGVKFVVGFKFCMVYLIYLLPIFILILPIMVLAVLGEMSDQKDLFGIVSAVYTFGMMLIIIPYSLLLTLAMPIISYRFAENERIVDALDIGAIANTFKKHWQSTLVVALIAAGIQSLASVGVIFFFIGVLFTLFYAYLVTAYLNGALAVEQTGAGA
jgi:hypothetical protein